MDFFEHQDQARRKTKWLVLYFLLSLSLIILAIYLAAAAAFLRPPKFPEGSWAWLWNLELFLFVVAGTVLVILSGSAYKVAQLSQGGGVLARTLGGRLVDHGTTDPDERRLVNVVEEMAIASGMPVPEIYVLDHEQGINAFAAGNSTTDAAVGVTRGTMETLNRDELQGVIAHEFSHILNGDMRLNLRLIGILHGLLIIALIGRIILQPLRFGRVSTGRSRKGEGGGHFAILILGIALLIIGSIGVFFGRLIKSAVSRQREYLADAAAVQFTRNPGGIAGALKKIGGMVYGSRLRTPKAEEASHLFFGNGLGVSWASWMSTHPPLVKRIQRIDPSFDGKFPRVKMDEARARAREAAPPPPRQRAGFPPVIGRFDEGAGALAGAVPPSIPAADVLSQAGTLTPRHLAYAEALRVSIPEALADAAHDSFGATALVYGMLLSRDPEIRKKQLADLADHAHPAALRELEKLRTLMEPLELTARLPLVDMALPALRVVSVEQYLRFTANTRRLIESDRQIDLFEYTLLKILTRHLDPHFGKVNRPLVQYYSLRGLLDESAVLLSALAHMGHQDDAATARAFRAGAAQLDAHALQLLSSSECNLPEIDRALDKINEAVPALKRQILAACAHTVAADGMIQPREAEMLRAVAEALDCPLPPFLPQTHQAQVSSEMQAK